MSYAYSNIEPLQNKLMWGQPNPMLAVFQQQGQQIANNIGRIPYMEVDPNQNTRQPITAQEQPLTGETIEQRKRYTRGFNPEYMQASNMLFTGLGMLGAKNKNSYGNAVNDFNKGRSEYNNLNSDLYSTKQDYYGKFQKGGLKELYDTMSLDPESFQDELQFFQPDYDKIQKQQEINQYKSLKDYIDTKYNNIPKQKEVVEYQSYNPYDNYSNPYIGNEINTSPYDKGSTGYQPIYAPQMNIGFNPKSTNMYQTSRQLEGMRYQMGAKGGGNKIDCSGAVCKIVGAPTMTSEDVTTHGKNFRRFQGPQDLQEGTVLGFDFGPKKHDKGRKIGIDHTGVIVKNPSTNQLEYKESVSGTGFRTLSIPQFLQKYPNRAKQIFVSDYGKNK